MDARANRADRRRIEEGIRDQVRTREGGKEVLTVAGGEGGQKGERRTLFFCAEKNVEVRKDWGEGVLGGGEDCEWQGKIREF